MCGIVAYLGNSPGIHKLYEGLLILQNRGYDSAGISSFFDNNFLINKYASLPNATAFELLKPHLEKHKNSLNIIGHSRFSCSGIASDENSHPHIDFSSKFSLIHNGIIENYISLKNELKKLGIKFLSETDTEVIVNLIGYYYQETKSIDMAIKMTIDRLEGTWGLVIQCLETPDKLYCARRGSPLLIAMNEDFAMVSSEQSGFGQHFENYISLDNDDIITLEKREKKIKLIQKEKKNYNLHPIKNEKENHLGNFAHWTLKEIHEQRDSSFRAMENRILKNKVYFEDFEKKKEELLAIENLIILGCGTSFHAGLFTLDLFKKIGDFNTVQIFDGSDFEISDIPKNGKTGLIILSQSGETKDLHRCVEMGKEKKLFMIGVVNVVNSMIAKDVNTVIYLNSGREVGVASTKCFTSQVIVLNLIACWFAENKNIHSVTCEKILENLKILPEQINYILDNTEKICEEVATSLIEKKSIFLLGRGENKSIAMEGALKIKEIGYVNASGYSTASLKHGSYALLEKGFPVIILLPEDSFYNRNNSVGDELKSRQAYIINITDKIYNENDFVYNVNILIPKNETFFGVLSNICLQFIAYYIGIKKNINVDIPRNLCKTVTVD